LQPKGRGVFRKATQEESSKKRNKKKKGNVLFFREGFPVIMGKSGLKRGEKGETWGMVVVEKKR